MKAPTALLLLASLLLSACTTDSQGRTQLDPVKAGQWIDTGTRLLDALDRFNTTDTVPTPGGTYQRTAPGEYRYVPSFRTREIPSESPVVVLNGVVQ